MGLLMTNIFFNFQVCLNQDVDGARKWWFKSDKANQSISVVIAACLA